MNPQDLELSSQNQSSEALESSRRADGIGPRRLFGAYYTPDELAVIMAEWALSSGPGTVLDPSFGGCAFMSAAVHVLSELGVGDPGQMVYGVDIDRQCLAYVREDEALTEANVVVEDFFRTSPEDLSGAPFCTIVGNPPYIRHHWFQGQSRDHARTAVEDLGIDLPGRASAWAYFVLHSFKFLADNGRLAMLVPEAILQTNYGESVRQALSANFGHVQLIHIRERLFDETDEPVVVIAASRFGEPGSLAMAAVESLSELRRVLSNGQNQHEGRSKTIIRGRRLEEEAWDLLSRIESHEAVVRLSDLASVRIGIVTGANNYFIRGRDSIRQRGIPDDCCVPTVARTRWLPGLEYTDEDHSRIVNELGRAFLIRPTPEAENQVSIQEWIAEGEQQKIDERLKCSVRTPWYRIEVGRVPDAFATCTRAGSPLLVLNRSGCHCTNTLHSLQWHSERESLPEAVVVGSLSCMSALWAELHGRRYGGGVLKLEPGTLKNMPLALIDGAAAEFNRLNELFKSGGERQARALADELILRKGIGLTTREIRRLRDASIALQAQRSPSKNGRRHP